jgi:hypothetical protein
LNEFAPPRQLNRWADFLFPMEITYSLPLNDACWFLHQAEGLPEVPKSDELALRYLRSTVVFSWVALEQMLNATVDDYVAQGILVGSLVPERLRDKLEHVLAVNGKTLDRSLFKQHRDLRNEITHGDRVFSLSDIQATFSFCFDTIGAFYPGTLRVTHENINHP